jgi:CRP-like cAMP-binding protein
MSIERRREIFAQHPFFAGLSPAELESIVRFARAERRERGERIFAKGDPGQGLLAVVSGSVKVSVPSSEGREVVLNIVRDGDIFGEIALLDGRPRTADAVAWTDCELLALDRRDFLPVLREAPELALKLMEVLCERLRQTTEQVEDLMFLDLPGRLAKVLLRLAPPQEGEPVRITQRELGEIVGISRERINKQLRAWQSQRLVDLETGGVIIRDAAALARQLEA